VEKIMNLYHGNQEIHVSYLGSVDHNSIARYLTRTDRERLKPFTVSSGEIPCCAVYPVQLIGLAGMLWNGGSEEDWD
jgi:hypothetical protein